MLYLNRRIGETIFIGNDIAVTVRAIIGNQVKLGIAAPDNINIMREELKWKNKIKEVNGNLLSNENRRSSHA